MLQIKCNIFNQQYNNHSEKIIKTINVGDSYSSGQKKVPV